MNLPENFKTYHCRTCYNATKGLKFLTALTKCNDNQERSYAELLADVSQINITQNFYNDLPQFICSVCSRKLKAAHEFLQQTHEVNQRLLAMLSVQKDQENNQFLDNQYDCDDTQEMQVKMEFEVSALVEVEQEQKIQWKDAHKEKTDGIYQSERVSKTLDIIADDTEFLKTSRVVVQSNDIQIQINQMFGILNKKIDLITENNEILKSQLKEIQEVLDSVLEKDEPTTSKQRKKMAEKHIDGNSPPLPNNKEEEPKETTKDACVFAEFKEETKTMLQQISKDIKSLKRSYIYEIKKLEERIGFYFNSKDNLKSLSELKDFLHLNEPLATLDSFEDFEKKLETEKEFMDALCEIIAYKIRGKNLTDAVNNFLSFILEPQLQVQFSGCGKINKGVIKKNFSSTITYNTLKENLLMQFTTETESNILTKTSRWFANSKDRYLGRKSKN